MKTLHIVLLLTLTVPAFAQVEEIKSASEENSDKKSSRSDGGDGSDDDTGGFFLFDVMFNVIPEWQRIKLQDNRERYPSMVSLDVLLQGAAKPSAYYILWPRVRGNWGLFSTDFRMNYLIEEDTEGYTHIRTNDWQILQLNLITSRFITLRIGTGVMTEAFGSKESFNEWAFLFDAHAPDQSKVLGFEYRFAKDWETGANPRREFSAQYMHRLFEAGALNGYVSAGIVYQRYYNSIEVWGVQAGFVIRIF